MSVWGPRHRSSRRECADGTPTPPCTAPLTLAPPPFPPSPSPLLSHAQVVLKAIQPYTRVRIASIAAQLNAPPPEVEQLLVSLILDGRVAGRIDQVNQVRVPGCAGGCGGVRGLHGLLYNM